MRRVPSLAIACLLVCAAACEEEEGDDASAYSGPVNSCGSDADCAEGACREDLGRCVVTAPAGRGYYFEVTPDPGTEVPYQVFSAQIGEGGAVPEPCGIVEPVEIDARAAVGQDADSGAALDGAIYFADVGNRLPGHPARITAYQASGEKDISLSLLPGEYRIMVVPEGAQAATYPVLYLDGIRVDEDGALLGPDSQPVDIVVPEPETEVVGAVLQGGSAVDGLTVRAVDEDLGRVLSTEGTTACPGGGDGPICGEFSISLAPGVSEFSLEISRPSEPHHPTVTVQGFSVPAGQDEVDLTGDPGLDLEQPGMPVRYFTAVEGIVTSSGGDVSTPVPGCFVLFQSDDVAGGSVSRWVTTNESASLEGTEGKPGVDLYPAQYTVTVIPPEAPPGSTIDFGPFVTPTPLDISGAARIDGPALTLSERPVLEGLVTAGGEPVPGSGLSAEPHADAPEHLRASTGSSGADGSFRMWVDAGRHRVVAEAPAPSGFGWGRLDAEVSGDVEEEIALPIPFAASLSLESQGVELAGAQVEVYEEVEGTAFPVGRASADASGEVLLLLPP